MVVLRFASEEVRRACSDPVRMRQRWGPTGARQISRRLQQLEAMEAITDLAFLPLYSRSRTDGAIDVDVNDHLTLLVQPGVETSHGGRSVSTILVSAVYARSSAARAS